MKEWFAATDPRTRGVTIYGPPTRGTHSGEVPVPPGTYVQVSEDSGHYVEIDSRHGTVHLERDGSTLTAIAMGPFRHGLAAEERLRAQAQLAWLIVDLAVEQGLVRR